MSEQKITKVTRQSWGSRIMESIKGVLFGLILFLASFVVLWWNEGRAVKTAKGLDEGAAAVVSLENPILKPENEGQLIHFTGIATTDDVLTDEEFGISLAAIRLRRNTEMYQWKENKSTETKKNVGGSEEKVTTYSYERVWSASLISSDQFEQKEGHYNPASITYPSYTKDARNVTVGEFRLIPNLISKISEFDSIEKERVTSFPDSARFDGSYLFVGKGSLASPQIGDMRITFEWVDESNVSVIAQQFGETLKPYQTKTATTIAMLHNGKETAESMFQKAHDDNTLMTWLLRALGFVMMFLGITLIFKPLVIIADVLPLLGSMLNMGLSLFAFLITFGLGFITIALAWIYYRPLLGIPLLIVGIASFVYFFKKARDKKKEMESKAAMTQ